jgi:alpha-tubulin suppressor-like RCC1 family protein
METNSSFSNNLLSNKLKNYFESNIKFFLKYLNKLFIITKSDIFYEIIINDETIPSFILSNDKSILDKMIVKELCHKNIIDLSYGERHYFARTIENKIYCWGRNCYGVFGNGKCDNNYQKPELNELLSDLNITDIKCGTFRSLALTQSGKVYEWGDNSDTLSNEEKFLLTPNKVNGFNDEKVVMISCGCAHSAVLTESGRVYGWGFNMHGQLGIGNTDHSYEPVAVQIEDISFKNYLRSKS